MRIVAVSDAHRDAWLALRIALWPDEEAAVMPEDVDRMLAAAHGDRPVWIAVDESGVVGFAEASLRRTGVRGRRPVPDGPGCRRVS